MKVFSWILVSVFLLLILAGAALVWFYTSNPKIIFEAVAAQLHNYYSLDIKADNVGFDLLHGVEVSGVSVSGIGDEKFSKTLSFQRGSILYNPFALFYKKIDINNIKISGLNTSIDMIKKLYSVFSKRSAPSSLSFTIRRIEISDSLIIYNDNSYDFYLTLHPDRPFNHMPVYLTVKSPFLELVFRGNIGSGNLKIRRADIDGIFKTVSSIKIDNLETSLSRDKNNLLSCSCMDMKLYYKNMYFKSESSFKLFFDPNAMTITVNDISAAMSGCSALITNLFYSIPDKKLVIDARSVSIEAGDFLNGAVGRLSGEFSLISKNDLILSCDFKISGFKYFFIQMDEGQLTMKNNSLKADVNALIPAISALVHIESDDIFSRGFSVQARIDEIDLEKVINSFAENKMGNSESEIAFSRKIRIFPIIMDLDIKKILYKKLSLTDVRIRGEAQPGLISIKELKGQFFRGTLFSVFKISHDSVTGEASLNGCKLKDFSDLFLTEGKRLYGSISFKGIFDIPRSDISLASCSFEASVINGEVKDFFLQERIAQTLFDIPMNDIFFDSIMLRGKYEMKKFFLEESSFESREINASATGSLSFLDNTIDINGKISILSTYLADLPNVTQIFTAGHESDGRVNFNINAAGSLSKPVIRIQ